ncbi:cysteine hydrolase family protein [Massilia endophytica]|uniref:cysteine hydrolase family protein n=1 Tax=Massilia endophytica TaxID=2899220 RepID=UPI001E56C43D|nr:cysteine hydrolase family protein [Massilia endophytica]UGQ47037.1 cysteine hydrolase [Massilia endophytica]
MTQTIRSIGGAKPAAAIDPASTALVLIDFQNEYYDGRLPIPDGMGALRNALALVRHADRHGIPVFHVRHQGAVGGPIFARGSRMAEIHPELAPQPHHHVVDKTTVSTFASTDLDAQLRAMGVKTLIVSGLMTHMCVSTAVRDARQFGDRNYSVLLAADACATRDIEGWDGGVVSHAVLHGATLTALSDNFAEVLPTAAIINLPVKE